MINRWRIRRKLTQHQLAKRVGIPQPNLSNIEKGKRDITVSTLERISIALGVKPAQLLEWEDAGIFQKNVVWTRRRLESLAESVVNPNSDLSSTEKRLGELIRQLVPLPGKRRQSVKKTVNAWTELKVYLTTQEIKTIHQRIMDALSRKKAHQ